MTAKEKVDIYEKFFHQLQLHMSVTLNHSKVNEGLKIIDMWSYAHRIGNGELTDKAQKKLIENQIMKMKEYR